MFHLLLLPGLLALGLRQPLGHTNSVSHMVLTSYSHHTCPTHFHTHLHTPTCSHITYSHIPYTHHLHTLPTHIPYTHITYSHITYHTSPTHTSPTHIPYSHHLHTHLHKWRCTSREQLLCSLHQHVPPVSVMSCDTTAWSCDTTASSCDTTASSCGTLQDHVALLQDHVMPCKVMWHHTRSSDTMQGHVTPCKVMWHLIPQGASEVPSTELDTSPLSEEAARYVRFIIHTNPTSTHTPIK